MELNFDPIDSELKAYLIGLFYADAYLSDRVLQLRLSIKDKEYVEKLANIINVKTRIKDIKNKNGKTYQSCGFSICDKKLIDDLKKIGFIKRKSYQRDDIVFRNIPDNFKRHFIRGYFDGDGTIGFNTTKKERMKDSIKCVIGFVSINKELLNGIKNYLSITLELSDKKLRSENSGRFISETNGSDPYDEQLGENEIKYIRLIYSGNVICKKILDFLYKNSTIYMDRKYNKYKEIKIFEPKFYNYDKRHKRWRAKYNDDGGIKYKFFKNEIDAQEFIKNTKDPDFEIENKEPKGYYRYKNHWLAFYKDEKRNKRKCFKTEKEAQIFAQNIKNKIKTYETFISKVVK